MYPCFCHAPLVLPCIRKYDSIFVSSVPVTPELVANQYAAFSNVPIKMAKSDSTSIDPKMRAACTLSWNVTIERELRRSFVVRASHLGSSASRLYSTSRLSRMGSGGLLDPSCITTRFAADIRDAIEKKAEVWRAFVTTGRCGEC